MILDLGLHYVDDHWEWHEGYPLRALQSLFKNRQCCHVALNIQDVFYGEQSDTDTKRSAICSIQGKCLSPYPRYLGEAYGVLNYR